MRVPIPVPVAGRAVLVLCLVGTAQAFAWERAQTASTIDVDAFRELARSAAGNECVDEQVLYVIDDRYVVRWTQGRCADARGGVALYGAHPDEVLCGISDSFAGPQRGCRSPSARPLFESVLEHLNGDPDASLPGHVVRPLRWRPWWHFW